MLRDGSQANEQLNGSRPAGSSVSRRRFLAASVGSLVGVALAPLLTACGGGGQQPAAQAPTAAPKTEPAKAGEAKPATTTAGGFSGGGSLKILARSHFVPAYDKWLDQWAADWGKKNNVEVAVDHLLAGELPAKIAAEVAAGGGHDIYGFTFSGGVNLYNKQLVDVSDLAKQLADAHGGWVEPLGPQLGTFEGVWKGLPDYFAENSSLYRKDLFDANNLKAPETWEDLLKAGTILKEKGHPIGIAINQKSNDANNTWNAVLWCYGASYVDKDGKTVTINSPETREALKLALELYRNAMTDEVLSWGDTENNQFLASGRGSWIQNPISALRTIEKEKPDLAKNIYVALPPGGPKGRYTGVATNVWGIMNWSKNVPAAKAFLTDYFASYIDAVKASEGYNQPLLKGFRKKPMPIIGEDPKLQVLQDFDQVARATGFPGPPTPAAAEVESNWIIPLMVARLVQSGNIEEAIEWAAQKIEAIYAKYK